MQSQRMRASTGMDVVLGEPLESLTLESESGSKPQLLLMVKGRGGRLGTVRSCHRHTALPEKRLAEPPRCPGERSRYGYLRLQAPPPSSLGVTGNPANDFTAPSAFPLLKNGAGVGGFQKASQA